MPDLIRHLPSPHSALDAESPPSPHAMPALQGYIYLLANKHNNVLYLGVTRNLQRRLAEHKLHINQGFSAKYNTDKLVYFERYDRLDVAIRREKQLKKWRREWKDKLINDFNPDWKDMAEEIGCNADYIQSVQAAYASGSLIPGSPSPHSVLDPHAGLDPASPDPAYG